MIQINPLKSYIDGGVRAALTTPPSASLVFDLPGKAIWVKGVKLKGTDHTYTFSHDNYITLTNTPDSNESEDIKIGVNTSALKSAIDTTYGVVSTTANGLAPKFTSGNKQAAAAATTYYFLGWAGSTLKWYQAPFRNVRINSETTDCLGVNNTDPLIISSGNGISVTWDSTNKKIIITNTKPDVNHNTDTKVAQSVTTQNKNYAIILKGNDSDEGSITTVNFSTYLKFNPSTKRLTINGNKVITTIDTFIGATTSADGSVGLVTKPLIANRLQFLRGDGTWATPIDTWRPVKVEGTEKLGSNALDLSAGNGISIIYNSDTKKIIITNTKPDVNHNTHYTTMLYIGENNDTKANKNVANPYLKLFDDNARRATFQIKAGNGIAVASDANGNITITNSSPDVNHNTDRTGIKLTTVSGTKKTDSTLILANSTTGLNIQGGTNKFLIGNGTNYIEVPIVPSVSNKDATIGTTLTTLATIAGVDIKAKIASYSLSNHTHSVKINGSTKTIAAPGGTAVDLGSYLPLSGGTMALGEGLKFHSDENYFGTNADARIISLLDGNGTVCDGGLIIDERATSNGTEHITELLRIRDSEFKWRGQNILHAGNSSVSGGGSTWGSSITVKINGTSKTLTIPSNPNTDISVKQTPKTDNINRPLMMINGNTSTGEQINTSMFSTGIYANASTKMITANGFIKSGSSNNYVLLGGGGHKTISSIIEGGYIGTTQVQTSSKAQALSGISSINGRLSISAESDLTRLGFGGPHTVVFGEPGYAHRNYIFRPSYGSNGVTYTSLIIQNASAAASPTFTTSHSFDHNGNVYHSGKVGIGTTSPSYKLHVAGDVYTTTGFKKNGSSDSYILLGGGGHKLISDFATAEHIHTDTFSVRNHPNYVDLSFRDAELSKKANEKYIECWDGAGGWMNWMAGKWIKAGSDDSYVLLGGGGHKAVSDFAISGHNHDGRYLRWNGSTADISAMSWGTLTAANGYTILSHAASSDGGDVGFTSKGGKIFMQLDGYYYQNEGRCRVLDTSDFTAFSNASSQTTRITIGEVTKDLKIDADTVDTHHAGYQNNNVALLCPWPGMSTMKNAGFLPNEYGTSGYGHPDNIYLQAICKWAIATYSNQGDITLIGEIAPNSSGTCILHLYSSSGKDSSTLLPRYCSGTYTSLSGYTFHFGTVNYSWYYKREALTSDIPTVTNYYWANIKVSASSSTSTQPTFNTCYTSNWFRSTGATGWYSETYGGGWRMTDTTYIRVYGSKRVYNDNTSQYAFYTSGGMTALGHMWSSSSAQSWLDGQRSETAALNIAASSNTGAYWPWFRQTLTAASKWISVGTLNTSLYFIGSATSRTGNSYDYGFVMNFSNGTFSSSGNIYAPHFYENSDIRYKKILNNLLINSNTIANLPLFDFEWIENNTIGTGTSAQAVQEILPNLVSGTDKLTLDYGVLGTIAGITACKELVTQKSELQQLKEKVKQLEDRLRKYENTL